MQRIVISSKAFLAILFLSLYITVFGLFWPIDFKCFFSAGECLKVYGYPFVIYKLTQEGYLVGNKDLWVLVENFVFWLFFITFFWVSAIVGLKFIQKISNRR